jgi:glycosyltransferase involved in cell wall biosynthesis
MINAYQSMDALVCTSTIETYPTTLMEGFSSGVMGFGFNVGGVPEILDKMGREAIKAFDPAAMAQQLLAHASVTKNTLALHEKAQTVFDQQITARAYSTIYTQLLNH